MLEMVKVVQTFMRPDYSCLIQEHPSFADDVARLSRRPCGKNLKKP
jgi:hypothetical protein